MRVQRGQISKNELIAAFPTLESKSSSTPTQLNDSDRRLLLDLPASEEEAANIHNATSLSRAELLAKAVESPDSLSTAEMTLLMNRFWSGVTPEERSRSINAIAGIPLGDVADVLGGLNIARQAACAPNEAMAFWNAEQLYHKRATEEMQERTLNTARPWVRQLYGDKSRKHWGYVAIVEREAQRLGPSRLDDFFSVFDLALRNARDYIKASETIGARWMMHYLQPPQGPSSNHGEIVSDNAVAELRRIFSDFCESAEFAAGVLTNTFLVVDPTCIDSVMRWPRHYDDARILAIEADYPHPGRAYAEGYCGYMWVRLQQLCDNFFMVRLLHDDVGMDKLWRAAQASKHHAFVSMDEQEAKSYTASTNVSGPLEGSLFRSYYDR
ncbi:hypothetical protein LTR50_007103 [Elasticomyces elasticus]|nr:hypothetical protein LTR50_007103 [Elasticomyces elasticus]